MIKICRHVLPLYLLDDLNAYLTAAGSQYCKLKSGKRGTHKCIFLGHWTPRGGKYYWKVYRTPASYSMFSRTIAKRFAILWTFVSDMVALHFIDFAVELNKLPKKYRMFDLFSLLIINITCGGKIHKDSKDFGYCVVFTLGDYKDGDLIFPEVGFVAKIRPGDIAIFKSSKLKHGNLPY
jgi:hypothetical protein